MKRRDFLALAGATAAAWPLAARAQQAVALSPGMKRLGFIFTIAVNDPSIPQYLTSLRDGLRGQGWQEARNLVIDYRWDASTTDAAAKDAAEVLALRPDVILDVGTGGLAAAKATRTVPVVFALTGDPIASGIITNMAHPDGNATGFTNVEPSVSEKWVELLHEVVPNLTTVGVIFNPTGNAPEVAASYRTGYEKAASVYDLTLVYLPVSAPEEIAPTIAGFASGSGRGLIIHLDPWLIANRAAVLSEVARLRLPAVSPHVLYADNGAAITYGLDPYDAVRGAADYAGRILNGTSVSELPVQAPTKYSLIVNMKTAKAQGLTIPVSILIRADQVIE